MSPTREIPNDPNPARSVEEVPRPPSNASEEQPDLEPGIQPSESRPSGNQEDIVVDPVNVPVPEADDDELVCDQVLCIDVEPDDRSSEEPKGWKAEFPVTEDMIHEWKTHHNQDFLFVATAAKRDRSEVKVHLLSPQEQQLFKEAKNKEISNWLSTGTVSKILRDKLRPEQILKCRWICVWKPLEEQQDQEQAGPPSSATHKAKARLVVLGFMDPELETIARDSPTLGRQSRMLLLQLVASSKWSLRSFDIRAAFLQGHTQKGRTLGLEPVEELKTALKMSSQEVCKLEKSAYSLIDAPFLWYKELDRTLQELGFLPEPFDPCLCILYKPDSETPAGIIGMHVDDGLCGGNEFFEEKLIKLEAKYPFGSKQCSHFTFSGIEVSQKADQSIVLSQAKYIGKINPISMTSDRRTCTTEPITDDEKQKLRALIGSLQFAAVNTRPDLSSRLSYLQSEINKATVQTLHEANRILHEAKKFKETAITIQPIPIRDLRFMMFSDASFASAKHPDSHTGMIILATHQDTMKNYRCVISPLSWGCKKIQKVVTSTLSAETNALQTSLDQLSWIRLFWSWILNPKINWRQPQKVFQTTPEPVASTTYLAQQLPGSVAVTDCKSLYDLVTRTAQPNCQEFRTQLQARAIKGLLAEGVQLRWVHTGAQLADALTKVMQSTFLRHTLAQGKYQLHDELQVLKQRADSRTRMKWLESGTHLEEAP